MATTIVTSSRGKNALVGFEPRMRATETDTMSTGPADHASSSCSKSKTNRRSQVTWIGFVTSQEKEERRRHRKSIMSERSDRGSLVKVEKDQLTAERS